MFPPLRVPCKPPLARWLSRLPDVLTWTSTDELALVDGESGAIRQVLATANLGGARDVIYDPWCTRAVVFEGGAGATPGEIATYAIEKGPLGFQLRPRLHERWVDGDARLLPSPLGVLMFEQRCGGRWRMLYSDEASSTAIAAPPPASAWITSTGWDFAVHALTYGADGELTLCSAAVWWKWMAPPVSARLGVAATSAPPSARLIAAPARHGALLVDVMGSAASVRLVQRFKTGPAALVPLGARGLRIEHAAALDGGEVVLLLLSGESRIVAIEMNEAGIVTSSDALPLPGAVREEGRFFSRDLALLGERRALAATSAGLFALSVKRGPGGVRLSFDEDFEGAALRGPIAPLAAEGF